MTKTLTRFLADVSVIDGIISLIRNKVKGRMTSGGKEEAEPASDAGERKKDAYCPEDETKRNDESINGQRRKRGWRSEGGLRGCGAREWEA